MYLFIIKHYMYLLLTHCLSKLTDVHVHLRNKLDAVLYQNSGLE